MILLPSQPLKKRAYQNGRELTVSARFGNVAEPKKSNKNLSKATTSTQKDQLSDTRHLRQFTSLFSHQICHPD
jgi:hypothetical protein